MEQDFLTKQEKLRLLVEERPWEGEPDHAEWTDERTGYKCAIHRHPELLHLNGYVGIPRTNPCYGMSYQEVDDLVKVHGGLTFDTKKDGLKWFGFDTGHADDLSPGILLTTLEVDSARDWAWKHNTYRSWEFVKAEVKNLAFELHQVVGEEVWSKHDKGAMK